jgi:peptide-methionine (S)-S-oxide reductase
MNKNQLIFMKPKTETATFGAGCFWHVQLAFDNLKGVVETEVGYMGGHMNNPTYDDVCTDETGHVEVCQVEFDPKQISYNEILDAFWKCHDPTQVDRQGPDYGTQYRSVVFYHSAGQKELAEKSKKALDKSGKLAKPVATAIEPAKTFYKAEDYHQKYLSKRGRFTC